MTTDFRDIWQRVFSDIDNAIRIVGGAGTGKTVMFDMDGTDNIVYIGKAEPGTATSAVSWSIMKLTYDGSDNITAVLWADGTDDAIKVWDSRTGYAYS